MDRASEMSSASRKNPEGDELLSGDRDSRDLIFI
jgi:hypothetical protein